MEKTIEIYLSLNINFKNSAEICNDFSKASLSLVTFPNCDKTTVGFRPLRILPKKNYRVFVYILILQRTERLLIIKLLVCLKVVDWTFLYDFYYNIDAKFIRFMPFFDIRRMTKKL